MAGMKRPDHGSRLLWKPKANIVLGIMFGVFFRGSYRLQTCSFLQPTIPTGAFWQAAGCWWLPPTGLNKTEANHHLSTNRQMTTRKTEAVDKTKRIPHPKQQPPQQIPTPPGLSRGLGVQQASLHFFFLFLPCALFPRIMDVDSGGFPTGE